MMIVVLHNIRSAYNVGSIFRTADACGVEKIYVCGYTPAPLDRFGRPNGQLAKVALNAEGYIPWEQRVSTTRLLDVLKRNGYSIFAVEQSPHSEPYFDISFSAMPHKIALVVGNEVRGLSDAILERADKIVEIPMRGKKESLNVAVAFGIVAFHFAAVIRKNIR